jgi:large subunit ribosomal protein L21
MATYAIISLGGKQYRVQEGQRLLVDRLPYDENKTFHPSILFTGGDGTADFSPTDVQVTARLVEHVLGDKIRIGKYKPKSGYKRHNGHRSRLSQIQIEAIGAKAARKPKAEAEEKPAKPRAEAAEAKPPAEEKAAPKPRKTATEKAENE